MTRRQRRDRQIEAVADGEALPEGRLDDPADRDALRAAIELRASRPGAGDPAPEFLEGLRDTLLTERAGQRGPAPSGVSRRSVVSGAVAAGLVGAAGVTGAVLDRTISDRGGSSPEAQSTIEPDRGVWVRIAATDEVPAGEPVRFTTPTLTGFVSRHGDQLVGVSGACTHQGCLLRPDVEAGRLDCPCHRTAFGYDGSVLFSQLRNQPVPLPRVQTRERGGQVEIYAPEPNA
jgi:nitrite reductase/ring-hydroxylating ferredoxin subunit